MILASSSNNDIFTCLTGSMSGLSLHKANWEDLYNPRVLDNVLETTDDLFSTSLV